ncbi:antibiotic biosynthesis monooxygenase [Aquabacter sp. CN5-332]|uniref:antibiotic biosynthesis monooxygenase n=1 Tax=Aquabacter sp. CN5-332 TaxID=3156608 RepID=UPI0032B49AB3
MSESTVDGHSPVALVARRRVAEASYAAYARWQARVVEQLRAWPDFVAHELIPPVPPAQMDWIIIQRFSSAGAAQSWLGSPVRAGLLEEIKPHLLEEEEVHLLADAGPRPQAGASAFIAYKVAPEDETAFLVWQRSIYAAEAQAPGFMRHKLERPVARLRDEWIIILTFDTDANLTHWLESPKRKALLEESRKLKADFHLSRAAYGFDFWFRGAGDPKPGSWQIFKNCLLVLLVLYPIVYLWGFFVDHPLLAAHEAPLWLSLFVGNVVSTQILGWWAVPAIFKVFGWWLAPDPGLRRNILGYAALALLYALSMAGFAALLAWRAAG